MGDDDKKGVPVSGPPSDLSKEHQPTVRNVMRLEGTVTAAVQAGRIDHLTITTGSSDSLAGVAEELARQVRARWTQEEERRRIHDPFPLPLRWRAAPATLTDHWANIRRLPGGATGVPLDLTGTFESAAGMYRRIPSGRLLVLGVPGAGKSVLAARLTLELLHTRAERDPVPVIVSLGSWNPAAATLRDWLTGQLVRDVPGLAAARPDRATLAAALVAHGRILPVLDGFDEIADGLGRAALEALNEYHGPLVLTSRRDEYATAVATTDVLTAAAGIDLVNLTVDDLTQYLPRTTGPATGVAAGWEPVLAALREDAASSPLTTVLSNPLMVALARAVYSDTPDHHPADLLDTHRFPTTAALEQHLLDRFVPTVYRHLTDDRRRWQPDHAQRWLGYLARLDGRDLAWWQLGTGVSRSGQALVVAIAVCMTVALTQGTIYGTLLLTMQPGALNTWLPYTFSIAVAAGLTYGLLFLIATRRRGGSFEPSRVHIRLRVTATVARTPFAARFRIGLGFGIVGGLLFMPAYELTSRLGFGLLDWLLFGITQPVLPQLLSGLINTAVWVVVVGTGAGIAAGLMGRYEVPVDLRSAANPVDLLHANRATALAQVALFGPAFGLILVAGGWLIIQLVRLAHGPLTPLGVVTALDWAMAGPLAGGAGYILALTAWGNWVVLARLWLPLTGRLPRQLLAFLDDAHRRGVLRQAGAVYQFRHARLQDHLANTTHARQGLPSGR